MNVHNVFYYWFKQLIRINEILTFIVALNKSISPLIFNFKLLKSTLSSLKILDSLVGIGAS